MNLTGILKSILLVAASMVIWHTPMTLLQAGGYCIALIAMFYYSAGGLDAVKSHLHLIGEKGRKLFSSDQVYENVPSSSEDSDVEDAERGEAGTTADNRGGATRLDENEKVAARQA